MDPETTQQRHHVGVTSYHRKPGGPSEITIGGLNRDEFEAIERMVLGAGWVIVRNGWVVARPSWDQPPPPADDPDLVEHWPPLDPQDKNTGIQLEMRVYDRESTLSPSIFIGHLCGYYYSPENYKKQAERVTSYGFNCMRSPRGPDGKFWEKWYLPGLWSAEGALKEVLLTHTDDKQRLKAAIDFLGRNVEFGTLDVVVQRLAMTMGD